MKYIWSIIAFCDTILWAMAQEIYIYKKDSENSNYSIYIKKKFLQKFIKLVERDSQLLISRDFTPTDTKSYFLLIIQRIME